MFRGFLDVILEILTFFLCVVQIFPFLSTRRLCNLYQELWKRECNDIWHFLSRTFTNFFFVHKQTTEWHSYSLSFTIFVSLSTRLFSGHNFFLSVFLKCFHAGMSSRTLFFASDAIRCDFFHWVFVSLISLRFILFFVFIIINQRKILFCSFKFHLGYTIHVFLWEKFIIIFSVFIHSIISCGCLEDLVKKYTTNVLLLHWFLSRYAFLNSIVSKKGERPFHICD